jgi:hypothetical protein
MSCLRQSQTDLKGISKYIIFLQFSQFHNFISLLEAIKVKELNEKVNKKEEKIKEETKYFYFTIMAKLDIFLGS